MALQLLELPNHTIISRRFARWVGVPMHRTIAAVKFAKVQPPRRRSKSCFFHSNPVCKFFYSCRVPRNPEMDLHVTEEEADELCLYRFQQYSRTFIRSWILQGKVFVDGKVANKAGTPVSDKALVQIIAEVPKYVCRAGHKLEAAIEQLGHAAMVNVMKEEATLVTLVKPQTEARRSQVGSGGVVSDPLVHQEETIVYFINQHKPLQGCHWVHSFSDQ